MTRPTFRIETLDEAKAAIEAFNAFHDGFMKRIEIVSRDEIDSEYGQSSSGVFDVEIDIAHYNYEAEGRPLQDPGRLIRCRFECVQDIYLDLQQGFVGNTIMFLEIHEAQRRQGGTTSVETCLCLRLGRQFYLERAGKWESRDSQLFTFSRATFEETAG